MRVNCEEKIIVIAKDELRDGKDLELFDVTIADFPRSRRPVEYSNFVVVHKDDEVIKFIKKRIVFESIMDLDALEYLHKVSRIIKDLVVLNTIRPDSLDSFDFEDVFNPSTEYKKRGQ